MATRKTEATVVRATPTPVVVRGSSVVIEAAEQYFNPVEVTIAAGTTVLWVDVEGTHDMVAEDRTFASAVLIVGESYQFTFNMPGQYHYVCTLHLGAGMWGDIFVVDQALAEPALP